MQVPGHHHGNRKFHDFGRLEAEQAQVQPPLSATADTDQPGGKQQHKPQSVEPGRPDPENMWRHLAQNQQRRQAYPQPGSLPVNDVHALAGCAVQNDQPEGHQQQQAQQQRNIQLRPFHPARKKSFHCASSCESQASITARATGAASLEPPPPCSTTTATAMVGLSKGA